MEKLKAPLVIPWVLAVTAVGCAGNDTQAPASFAVAQASIEQAERADAQRWAPNELASARENLRLAQDAQQEGEEELAARFATRAELDAEFAAAAADNREIQSALEELRATLDTLRRETVRRPPQPGDAASSQPAQ